METRRYIIFDTRLGLWGTARYLEGPKFGAQAMNQSAGYMRFEAKTITEVR